MKNTVEVDSISEDIMIWAEKKNEKYKRSLSDGRKKCPYCNAQWNWSIDRSVKFHREKSIRIECKKCGRTFMWCGGNI